MNADTLRQKWRFWTGRFDALTLRERVLSLAMALAVVWTGIDALLLEPALQRKTIAQQSLTTAESQAAALEAQLAALAAQPPTDPNGALREKAARLRQRIAEQDAQLHEFGQGLVPPADMPELLEKLLAETGGPRLEGFRKLPAADVLSPLPGRVEGPSPAPKPAVPEGQVYRHGVELTLSGNYPDLLAYLQAVENMPWKLLWGEVRLETDRHPLLRMRLTLYTLSLDRDWLTL